MVPDHVCLAHVHVIEMTAHRNQQGKCDSHHDRAYGHEGLLSELRRELCRELLRRLNSLVYSDRNRVNSAVVLDKVLVVVAPRAQLVCSAIGSTVVTPVSTSRVMITIGNEM